MIPSDIAVPTHYLRFNLQLIYFVELFGIPELSLSFTRDYFHVQK